MNTLPELQRINEVFIGKEIQKKSFRRGLEKLSLWLNFDKKKHEQGGNPFRYKVKGKSTSFTFFYEIWMFGT